MIRTFDLFRDFDRPLQELARFGSGAAPAVPLDVLRYDDHIELVFDLPGVDPESIELTVDGRELTLAAERTVNLPDDAQVISRQRPHGRFARQLHLGDGLDTERLEASYDHGVLTVTVPVAESAKPRRVTIGAGGPNAIEAEGSEKS